MEPRILELAKQELQTLELPEISNREVSRDTMAEASTDRQRGRSTASKRPAQIGPDSIVIYRRSETVDRLRLWDVVLENVEQLFQDHVPQSQSARQSQIVDILRSTERPENLYRRRGYDPGKRPEKRLVILELSIIGICQDVLLCAVTLYSIKVA